MTFKEYLISKGVEESLVDAIVSGMPQEKFYLANEEKLDERYAKLKVQNEQLATQLSTNQEELNTLKKSAEGNEELTKKLEELQIAFDNSKTDSETKLSQQQKEYAIKLALKDSRTVDDGIVYGLLDMDSINITDNGISGLDEQLGKLQESKPFLFPKKENDPDNHPPAPKIVTPGNPNGRIENENDPFAAKLSKYE